MTFTIKIALQPFEVSFEAGSVAEAVSILTEPNNELSKLAALATGVTAGEGEGETETATTDAAAVPEKGKRGRKPKPAPEAVAPPPIPVPGAAPPPAPAAAPIDTGIPPFLDRTGTATQVAPPPFLDRTGTATATQVAPPPPVAPPPVVAPPVGVLAGKVVAELKKRGEGAADAGKGLVDWLASAGMVVPGASFQEAIDCVAFLSDEKLAPVAAALQIQ